MGQTRLDGPERVRGPLPAPAGSAAARADPAPHHAGPDPAPPDSLAPSDFLPDSRPPAEMDSRAEAGAARPPVVPAAKGETAAPASLPALARQPTLAQIGRYALKRRLGGGPMGQVHEAWDPVLARAVAIKTLQFPGDEHARQALERRFVAEAREIGALSHAYIATVLDAGLAEQGVYLAMEQLQGHDLRAKLALGFRPGPAVVCQLVRRIADALAYAHARGVVHGDIKPANIFIDPRNRPRVLDFGIAGWLPGRTPPELEDCAPGALHYLAPEQLTGSAIDARTDVYALGVVFYELLAGRRAFPGDNAEQVTTAILTLNPAPAHLLRSDAPAGLSAIAAQAMARRPDDRFATAAEMARALREWFTRYRPVAAGQARASGHSLAPDQRRAHRPRRNASRAARTVLRRLRWAALSAFALAALAGLVIGLH